MKISSSHKALLPVALLSVALFCFFLSACGIKQGGPLRYPSAGATDAQISRDLVEIPQDLRFFAEKYTKDTGVELSGAKLSKIQEKEAERFKKNFFSPWTQKKASIGSKDAFWAKNINYGAAFSENARPYSAKEWEEIVSNASIENYPSRAISAILLKASELRAMPTRRPYFKNPDLAGEGYPFDYFLNSTLPLGTPVFLSHISTDGLWAMVESARVSGWLLVENLGEISKGDKKAVLSGQLIAVVKDNTVIYEKTVIKDKITGRAETSPKSINIGTVLFLGASNDLYYFIRSFDGAATLAVTKYDEDIFKPWPLPFSPENMAELGNELMGQAYGWAGYMGNRDCSAMLLDLFKAFGYWLPRNSANQANMGEIVNLEGLKAEEKEKIILEKAVPFSSLIYMPGHIALYLGEYEGRAIVFHNAWGLRTVYEDGSYGRAVIAKAVISSLRVGEELPAIASPASLLDRVSKMSIIRLRD